MPAKNKPNRRPPGTVSAEAISWINIDDPTPAALAKLKTRFPFFRDDDLADCLPPFQRPKLLERDRYLFMVLHFPVYDGKKRLIRRYEIDFFIGHDFLVTSHVGPHEAITALVGDCDDDNNRCLLRTADDPLRLTHDVLHALTVSCFPMITTVANDLASIEEDLFSDANGALVRDILRVRSNILTFRKAMQGHETSLDRLLTRGKKFFDVERLRTHFDDLRAHGREIRDFLDNDRDTIGALYDSHLSLISYRTNQEIKTLTALAFVVLPMSLVAMIFSMRAEHMPFVGRPADFWMMLAVIFTTMLALVLFLKRRKWL